LSTDPDLVEKVPVLQWAFYGVKLCPKKEFPLLIKI